MQQHVDEKRIGDYIVRIYQDQNPPSPREYDNFGKIVCFHPKYYLGDNHDYNENHYDSWDDMKKAIVEENNVGVILPLYLYEHGGLTISTSPFSCVWDSGQIGWIYCTKEQMSEDWIKLSGQEPSERCKILLEGEVKTYDQYLTGDVYGYKVFKAETCDKGCEHEEELDSCWDYYRVDACMEEGESIVNYYINKQKQTV